MVDAINFGPVVMPHLVKPPSDAYLQVRPVVTLDVDSSEDRIYKARVGWHRGRFPADDPCVEPIMLRAVALALGVEDSGVPSPSLLGLDVFRLTTHDQAAFCAKYGAGGACGR